MYVKILKLSRSCANKRTTIRWKSEADLIKTCAVRWQCQDKNVTVEIRAHSEHKQPREPAVRKQDWALLIE